MHTKHKKNYLVFWRRFGIIILAVLVLSKLFLFDFYRVQSDHMEDTIPQDKILMVNKLAYGARLPITLLSLPYSSKLYVVAIKLPYMRLPALSKPDRNDVVFYNNPSEKDPPLDKKRVLAGRIVALPGDKLKIDKKKVLVNDKAIQISDHCKFLYRVTTNGFVPDEVFLRTYEADFKIRIGKLDVYDLYLTRKNAKRLLQDSTIRYVRELFEERYKLSYIIYPADPFFPWNKDFYGPVLVPGKGLTIELNAFNIAMYQPMITEHENHVLEIKNDQVYIDSKPVFQYTFKQDYYFILSDNRDKAKDSRYWGFIPESHLIGKTCSAF